MPLLLLSSLTAIAQTPNTLEEEQAALAACGRIVLEGIRPIAAARAVRFQGKVDDYRALCRGGYKAEQFRMTPWNDWSQYWGTGDMASLPTGFLSSQLPVLRGVTGALLDLEYQRIELIKFNLFDNTGTYRTYVSGRNGVGGPALKIWPEMRLPEADPNYQAVGGAGEQVCKGDLIRGRTLTGICNDIKNPLMGSTGTLFARNVEFDTTFPDLGSNRLHPQPARRPPRPAEARSAGDQPQAVHAARSPTPTRATRATACRAFHGRQLRLPEGAVLQRARRLLDPVHDARLVLAPGGRPQRAAA